MQEESAVFFGQKELQPLQNSPEPGTGEVKVAGNNGSSDQSGALTLEDLDKWQQDFEALPAHRALSTILSQQDPLAKLITRKVIVNDIQVFNHKLTTELKKITDQNKSGRCWLFATLNMARIAMAKKYNIEDFEFSQSYPMFYDHLEKANNFLENMIDLAEDELDSRIINHLISDPVRDGGEWVFGLNILERYGVIPQALCPESFSSGQSEKMNQVVNTKVREHCLELRKIYQHTKCVCSQTNATDEEAAIKAAVRACRDRKEEQLREIYTILAICLGTPPSPDKKFTYEFYDKKGDFQSLNMTPLEMLADLAPAFKLSDCITLVNHPHLEVDKLYTVDRMQNVDGGKRTEYINLSIDKLEEAVINMIKADEPVWCVCDDSPPTFDTDKGIWDVDIRDYEAVFGSKFGMDKAARVISRESAPTHVMLITAVHIIDEKPVRYRIDNSWGESAGDKGYFVCTAEWFRQYTYVVAVPRSFAPPEAIKILEAGNAIVLPRWATMA